MATDLIRRATLPVLALAAALNVCAQPAAQAIELVVPFPPGGSADPIARALQTGMKDALGKAIVIVNQAGAGGTLGTARVARAAPDGQTVALTTTGPLATQPYLKKLSYGLDSFEYVCRTHVTPQVLAVPENSPFKTLKDLVDYAKANPGKLALSSTGTGSIPHLAAVEFGKLAGFEWLHAPSKGDSDAARLALGGEVAGWIAGVPIFVQLAGRLRALGILEKERTSDLPDVPTFTELGYPLVSTGWGGLVVPKGTPAATVRKLSDACATGTGTPMFQQIIRNMRVPQGYLPAKEFAAFAADEYARYGRVIKSSGIDTEAQK